MNEKFCGDSPTIEAESAVQKIIGEVETTTDSDAKGFLQFIAKWGYDASNDRNFLEKDFDLSAYFKKVKEQKNITNIQMKTESIKKLANRFSYETKMIIAKMQSCIDGTIPKTEWEDRIIDLEHLGAFRNCWYCVDRFYTNSVTRLSAKSLFGLKKKYEMEYEIGRDLCFVYGHDESLSDGEVKWIHVEYYNEH